MTRSGRLRILVVCILAIGILSALIYRQELSEHFQQWRDWVQAQGIWGYVILGLAYIPAALLFIPASWLTLAGGAGFGLWAVVPISLGSTTGASGAFLAGRYLFRHWVEDHLGRSPRVQALDRAVADQGFKIVLLTRLSPLIPFNFLNYALGLTRVRFCDFLLASWLGMLPGTFLYVYVGSAVGQAASGDVDIAQNIFWAVGLLVTVVVTVLVTRLARRALTQAVPLADPASDLPHQSQGP